MTIAEDKSRLVELTEAYLSAGQFNKSAQHLFSTQFHRHYHSADLVSRVGVAKLLCNSQRIPLDVITLLCCDDDRVASPILSNTPLLGEADLTTQILQGTKAEREAIAKRSDLHTVHVSNILSFGEKEVARSLLDNIENLPNISDRLRERIFRLGGADLQPAGQQAMNNDKQDLDKLVSSMEETWFEHYQPKAAHQSVAEEPNEMPTQTTAVESSEMTPLEPTAAPQTDESASFLNDDDMALLEQLGGEDWDQLDDDAIEALARSLAQEDLAQSSDAVSFDEEVGPNRFRIGANDAQNAPIPQLEPTVHGVRRASISFLGQIDSEEQQETSLQSETLPQSDGALLEVKPFADLDLEKAFDEEWDSMVESWPAASSSEAAASQAVAPSSVDEELQASLKRPLDDREAEILTGSRNEALSADSGGAEESEAKKPQIRLTIRKKPKAAQESQPEKSASTSTPSVQLASATEDDWLQALARLTDPSNSDASSSDNSELYSAPELSEPSAETIQDIPVSFSEPVQSDAHPVSEPVTAKETVDLVASTRQETIPEVTEVGPVREHAPLGFMPDMISLEDLELVEAEPDLPSATDLLLAQQKQSAPMIEMVEPVDLAYFENDKLVSVDDTMKVVTEQLAAERQVKLQESAHAVSTQEKADVEPAKDMTELPEMAEHTLVEAADYESMRATETGISDTTNAHDIETAAETASTQSGWNTTPVLREITGDSQGEGIAESFYQYDDETRLLVLQEIISDSLLEATQLEQNIKQRRLLPEAKAEELVMARFGNDRIFVADMMHDISGHRRLDMTHLLQDKGGEALVVYLYHIGLDESSTLSMLLHGPDAVSHSYQKVAQLMTLYGQLYPAAAERIVTQLFGEGRSAKATHMPIHDQGAGIAAPRFRQGGVSERDTQENSAPAFGRRVSRSD